MNPTRRSLLINGTAASLLSLQTRAAAPSARSPALKIVVAGGHPGDPEYGCGGTIAGLVAQGHEVVLLYLNDGAWPPTSAVTRRAEAAAACHALGARALFAGQTNGHAIVDAAQYESYARLLAAETPDALFTHWPIDNHRDHRATANLCFDAWQAAGRRYPLYFYEVSSGEDTVLFAPTRYVDTSAMQSPKRAACFAHASQTPERYFALQDSVSQFRGLECGAARAEAFVLQIGSPCDILASPAPLDGRSRPRPA